MHKYIILLGFLIIFSYIFIHKVFNFKEGAEPPLKNQIKSGKPEGEDYFTFFSPRESEITELRSAMDKLQSIVPITFAAGNISYDRIDEPSVSFSGEIPYIFINIKLPYPKAGKQGETGDKGQVGADGQKGPSGDKGVKGYTGSNMNSWAFQG